MAKIAPTTSVPEFIPPHNGTRLSHSQGPLKKDQIQLSHLPSKIHHIFQMVFTPLLHEKFGNAQPWNSPSKDNIHELWSQIFKDALSSEEIESVVFKLVSPTHSCSESENINDLHYR